MGIQNVVICSLQNADLGNTVWFACGIFGGTFAPQTLFWFFTFLWKMTQLTLPKNHKNLCKLLKLGEKSQFQMKLNQKRWSTKIPSTRGCSFGIVATWRCWDEGLQSLKDSCDSKEADVFGDLKLKNVARWFVFLGNPGKKKHGLFWLNFLWTGFLKIPRPKGILRWYVFFLCTLMAGGLGLGTCPQIDPNVK